MSKTIEDLWAEFAAAALISLSRLYGHSTSDKYLAEDAANLADQMIEEFKKRQGSL